MGGNVLQNGLGLIFFPLLAVAFIIVAASEALLAALRALASPGWDAKSAQHEGRRGELAVDVFDLD
eukprot:SAG11_NODE_26359_length_346_cov_0.834008_1_plen_65_part_10